MGHPTPELYGIPVKELARICKVDLSTARRWKRGAICPPKTALMILARDLGCFAAQWRGWTVNGEDLVAPSGWCVNRNDALIVPLMHGQISALRAKVVSLEAARDDIENQPEPGELPTIKQGKPNV
jgi:hypothetical protein